MRAISGRFLLLEELERFKPLRAVWGNIDADKVRAAVPRDLQWECEGLRIYMTHIGKRRMCGMRLAVTGRACLFVGIRIF